MWSSRCLKKCGNSSIFSAVAVNTQWKMGSTHTHTLSHTLTHSHTLSHTHTRTHWQDQTDCWTSCQQLTPRAKLDNVFKGKVDDLKHFFFSLFLFDFPSLPLPSFLLPFLPSFFFSSLFLSFSLSLFLSSLTFFLVVRKKKDEAKKEPNKKKKKKKHRLCCYRLYWPTN